MVFVDIARGAQIDVSPCDVTQLFAQRRSLRDTWCSHLGLNREIADIIADKLAHF